MGAGALAVAGWVVMAQVLEVALLEERPAWGTFYSLQKTNEPPLPFNPWPDLPLYWLGETFYGVDDRAVDYVAVAREAELMWLLSVETGGLMSLDGGPPFPGEGGGEGGTNDPPAWGGPGFLSYTGLCLYPPAFTVSNTVVLVLTNGEANAQYDLFNTTNLAELAMPALSLTNWIWLMRGDPGQTEFNVTNSPLPESYYALGTMLDSDNDGLSDAYELWVSHTAAGTWSNPDTDGDGLRDGWEILQGLNPSVADAGEDPDGDGLTNWGEWLAGGEARVAMAWGVWVAAPGVGSVIP
jgi:hypothetical protein